MQPVIIEDSISIAANAVNENVIVSNASLRGLLQTPFPGKLKILAVCSAAGLRIDFTQGTKQVVSSYNLRVATVAEDPLDVVNDEAYAEAAEQLVLRCSNSTGGALTLRYRIQMIPWADDAGNFMELPPDTLVMQRLQSIAAAAVDIQLLDGLMFERISTPSILRVLMTANAAGLLRALYIEQDRIAPPSAISIANRIPQDPFDTTVEGVEVPENSLQQLQVSNPTGGAIVALWKTKNAQLVRT